MSRSDSNCGVVTGLVCSLGNAIVGVALWAAACVQVAWDQLWGDG
jgi:hypothetical protein